MRDERCLRKVFHTGGRSQPADAIIRHWPPGIIYPSHWPAANYLHFYTKKMLAKKLHTVDFNTTDYATKLIMQQNSGAV